MLPKTIYGLATTSSPGLMSAEDKAKLDSNVVTTSLVGANNGIAQLDSSGKVPASQLPSYVDDVLEYNSASAFPATGEADKIYIAKDTNISYRWGGSAYVKIASDLALGETSSSAYRGDHGKTAYDHATDASRLTTAATSGLYKVAVTNEGHVASVTAVQKSDITNLGIPGSHQDISGKADKVSGATNGNFAGLDSNGNLTDSGKKAADFLSTSAIDDTAGDGDTNKTWSADKLVETFEETEEAAALCKVIDTHTQVVSFSDGAHWPMKLEFGIEPVQDLHGYDKPWPASGGKNLLPLTVDGIKALNTSGSWSGNAYTLNDVTFTILTDNDNNVIGIKVNGTASSDPTRLQLAVISNFSTNKLSGCPSGGSSSGYKLRVGNSSDVAIGEDIGSGYTIPSDSTYKISINLGNGVQAQNLVFYPMIRLSAISDSTFAPYSNICPISGFDGAKVSVTGKNLFTFDMITYDSKHSSVSSYIINGDNSISITTNQSFANPYVKFVTNESIFPQSVFKGKSLKLYASGAKRFVVSSVKNGEITYLTNSTTAFDGETVQLPNDGWDELEFVFYGATREIATVTYSNIMFIFADETDSTYESYSGHIYPITFPISSGTVYGGTVKVNPDGTGELVVDRVGYEFDGSNDESWAISGDPYKYGYITVAKIKTAQAANSISNRFVWTTLGGSDSSIGFRVVNDNQLRIRSGLFTELTTEQWREYLSNNPTQIVYYINTPVTYQLPPGQVLSLLGQNNVWANCGQINHLEYVRNVIGDAITERIDGIENDTCSKTIDQPYAIQRFDGGSPYPMGLTVGIVPVQDLHGYDHPWPGGSGKNMIPLTLASIKSKNTVGTWNNNVYTRYGITFTVNLDNDGNVISITVNGTADGDNPTLILDNVMGHERFPYNMVLNGCPSNGSTDTYYLRCQLSSSPWTNIATDIGNGANLTIPDNGNVYSLFIRVTNGVSVSNKVFYPMSRLATETDSTFVPYSNICPISESDSANVTVTGKNLADLSDWFSNGGATIITGNDGVNVTVKNGWSGSWHWGGFNLKKEALIGKTITLSCKVTANVNNRSFVGGYCYIYANKDGTRILNDGIDISAQNIKVSKTIVIPDDFDTIYLCLWACGSGTCSSTESITYSDIQIEEGYVASDFEPFGKIYPITFPTSAGTVYGGTVTVNPDGTGELVVDKAMVVCDGSNDEIYELIEGTYNYFVRRYWGTGGTGGAKYVNGKAISNLLPSVPVGGLTTMIGISVVNNGDLRIRWEINNNLTLSDLKTWLQTNPLYTLLDLLPQYQTTYSLTAPQVLSLLGQNNVWADTGDILSITYNSKRGMDIFRQDTAGQINTVVDPVKTELDSAEAAMAIVVDGDTAPKNITKGQYVFVKNHSTLTTGMYHATAAIASGASITGSNVEANEEGLANIFNSSILSDVTGSKTVASDTLTEAKKVTVSEAGTYLIVRGCSWAVNTDGDRFISRVNNIEPNRYSYDRIKPANDGAATNKLVTIENVAAGGSIYVFVYQNSGVSLTNWPYIFYVKLK